VVLLSPAELREIEQHPGLLDLVGLILPPHPAERVGAVEDEAAHPFGMAGRIFDGDRSALAGRHQRKLPEARGVDHAFEIAHPGLERQVAGVAVRKSAAAGVVAQDLVLAGEGVEPRPPG